MILLGIFCDRIILCPHAMSNPVKYIDPSGHRPCGEGEIVDCEGYLNDNHDGSSEPSSLIDGEGIADWTGNNGNDEGRRNDPSYGWFDDICFGYTCTVYASTGLHEGGGVPYSDAWNPNLGCSPENSWATTDLFFDYLNNTLHLSFVVLPILPKDGLPMTLGEIQNWFNANEIPPGSFVFYDINQNGVIYSHVAVINGNNATFNGINTPEVNDMNGYKQGPHSILNTERYVYNLDADSTSQMPYVIVIVIVP